MRSLKIEMGTVEETEEMEKAKKAEEVEIRENMGVIQVQENLECYVRRIVPRDETCYQNARTRWDKIAKPLHSLGLLEDAIAEIAGMTRSAHVHLDKTALIICCADNGVVEEGVTQTGQDVTAIVTGNFTRGNACSCLMAECCKMDVFPVDLGVVGSLKDLGTKYPLRSEKIAHGTKNLAKEPAMTREEAERAVLVGMKMVRECKEKGYQLLATGEMGIGNTTTSSAVVSVLLGKEPEEMTGRGAGLTDSGLRKKVQVIRQAISLHQPDASDGIDVLAKVGGFDLAGMAGVFLGGALYHIPVVIDGFISAAAALLAAALCPAAKDYMIASHASAEPAAKTVLQALGKRPVIQADMCLGEGTGAIAIVPLLQMASSVYENMSTFQENEIEEYKPL